MALATFQVLNSHMWLMAILLDRTDIEHIDCGRARLDGVRLGQDPRIWISASLAVTLGSNGLQGGRSELGP